MDYGTKDIRTGAIVRLYDDADLAAHVTEEMGDDYEVVQVKRSISED